MKLKDRLEVTKGFVKTPMFNASDNATVTNKTILTNQIAIMESLEEIKRTLIEIQTK